MAEGNLHQKYKEQVRHALQSAGWDETATEALRRISTGGLGTHEFLDYRLDIFASKRGVSLGIEVDNPQSGGGHLTTRERKKDKVRTKALYDTHGILVLRLEFYQIKGSSDEEIIEEIEYEIKRHIPTFHSS